VNHFFGDHLKNIVETLPLYNQFLLQHIMHFLSIVVLQPTCKMDANNLSIVFAPILLRSETENENSQNLSHIYPIVISFIQNYKYTFSEIETKREIKRNEFNVLKEEKKKRELVVDDQSHHKTTISTPKTGAVVGSIATIGLGEIVKQGNLQHKKKTVWVVVKKKFLYYFNDRKDKTPKGAITLISGTQLIRPTEINLLNAYSFTIKAGTQEMQLGAFNNTEMEEWMEAITSSISSDQTEEEQEVKKKKTKFFFQF